MTARRSTATKAAATAKVMRLFRSGHHFWRLDGRVQTLPVHASASRSVNPSSRRHGLTPKAEALDRFSTVTDGSFCLTDAAKALQVLPRKFTARLQAMGWIYRRPMGSGWLAYQDRITMGHMEHKVTTGDKSDGSEWSSTQVRVTAKGMARLALLIAKEATAA